MVEEYEFKEALKQVDRHTRIALVFIRDKIKELENQKPQFTIPNEILETPRLIHTLKDRIAKLEDKLDTLDKDVRIEYINPENIQRLRQFQYDADTMTKIVKQFQEAIEYINVAKVIQRMETNFKEEIEITMACLTDKVGHIVSHILTQALSSISNILTWCIRKGKRPTAIDFKTIHPNEETEWKDKGWTRICWKDEWMLIAKVVIGSESADLDWNWKDRERLA